MNDCTIMLPWGFIKFILYTSFYDTTIQGSPFSCSFLDTFCIVIQPRLRVAHGTRVAALLPFSQWLVIT